MHGAYCTRHRHRHRGGVSNKTPPPTELQIPATVTTLIIIIIIQHLYSALNSCKGYGDAVCGRYEFFVHRSRKYQSNYKAQVCCHNKEYKVSKVGITDTSDPGHLTANVWWVRPDRSALVPKCPKNNCLAPSLAEVSCPFLTTTVGQYVA